MNKKTEEKILDIAAELIVSPLALYVKAVEIKKAVAGSETYGKTKEAAKSAGNDIKKAAKNVYEKEAVQKGIEAVKDTARKVSETRTYQTAKEAVSAGAAKAKEGIDTVASKLGFADRETGSGCGDGAGAGRTEEAADNCCCTDASEEIPADGEEAENSCCCEGTKETEAENGCATEAEPSAQMGCCGERKAESLEDVIEEVDLSDIITQEDALENIPG